jgi:hypothetical protein
MVGMSLPPPHPVPFLTPQVVAPTPRGSDLVSAAVRVAGAVLGFPIKVFLGGFRSTTSQAPLRGWSWADGTNASNLNVAASGTEPFGEGQPEYVASTCAAVVGNRAPHTVHHILCTTYRAPHTCSLSSAVNIMSESSLHPTLLLRAVLPLSPSFHPPPSLHLSLCSTKRPT